MTLGKLLVCLDIFADVGLVELEQQQKFMTVRIIPRQDKADLQSSKTMQLLISARDGIS